MKIRLVQDGKLGSICGLVHLLTDKSGLMRLRYQVACVCVCEPFKRQYHKMVKHTQTIRRIV